MKIKSNYIEFFYHYAENRKRFGNILGKTILNSKQFSYQNETILFQTSNYLTIFWQIWIFISRFGVYFFSDISRIVFWHTHELSLCRNLSLSPLNISRRILEWRPVLSKFLIQCHDMIEKPAHDKQVTNCNLQFRIMCSDHVQRLF